MTDPPSDPARPDLARPDLARPDLDRIHPERLARLERQQALFVRLLFCGETLAAYREDADSLLARHGLEPSAKAAFPDVASPAFRAEARGRQSLVRREVEKTFPATRRLLVERAGRGAGAGAAMAEAPRDPLAIERFLSSDAFYDPRAGLPHPAGVGPGYENASKYFFWFRKANRIAAPGADVELRTMFYCDIAAYLMDLMTRPVHDYFRRFTGGVYWPRSPGADLPVHVLTEKLVLVTLNDAAQARRLPGIGLQNLDTIRPGEWEIANNI